ncbi:DegT/DnrJ/EryC1/StrS family aminotransferase [bacterium]|nr:DegT/DnrJ/EryC1/StrS family aminotransferase [bacterium]
MAKQGLGMSVRTYGEREQKLLQQVLASGKLSSLAGGKFVPELEKKFAEAIGTKYAVAMNCCMSALHIALLSAEVGAGDEVITDSEFVFGAQAVLYCNAIPVFVDINPVTHNMNPNNIEKAITKRTKAIIATHAWGLPAEIDRIVEIGHKHNLLVIEDCAESILAPYKGRNTGNWGDIGCFSFQSSKQLSTGDGGMATTNDEKLAKMLRQDSGAPTSGSIAYNLRYGYRMTETTAAVGLAQLERLPDFIEGLKINAEYFDEAVAECKWIELQRGPDEAEHSFYKWAATFKGEEYGIDREDFKNAIEKADFSSVSVGYTHMPNYKHSLIKEHLAYSFHCPNNKESDISYPEGLCPNAEHVIPRLLIVRIIQSEETAKREAEKLNKVIMELEK